MLREQIEDLFLKNSKYSEPEQAVNMASSLDSLSSDLYTDSNRFIYELLQNADDSYKNGDPVKVWIKLFGDDLIVAHTGSVFSDKDLRGICNINNGTKRSDPNKTGYKGIGFKAVFGQSKKVIIYSDEEYFAFDSLYEHKWRWEDTQADWEKKNDREFELPWQIIPIYTEEKDINESIVQFIHQVNANVATIIKVPEFNKSEICEAINKISTHTNTFIFLKNICEITFDIELKSIIKINREDKDIVSVKKDENNKNKWLFTEKKLQIPTEVKELLKDEKNIPNKLLEATSIQLTLAAKIGKDGLSKLDSNDQRIYSYLPTEERKYDFPVLINTNFLTTANRENLHVNSKWNQWIFKEVASSLFEWIAYLVKGEFALQAYHLLPSKMEGNSLGMSFDKGFDESLKRFSFVLCDDGSLSKIDKVIIDYTDLSAKNFIDRNSITEYLEKKYDKKITHTRKYSKLRQFDNKLKNLGAKTFSWGELSDFLSSSEYKNSYSIASNIELIKYLKEVSESGKSESITDYNLTVIPFIMTHKEFLSSPNRVCFPDSYDQNWNNPNSELNFIHPGLYDWLIRDSETRRWLEKIGVVEKTDITYITQMLIPQIETYITKENAVEVVSDIFNLYLKGEITNDLFTKLEAIKLITTTGELLSANECYLSNYYHPRLSNENILLKDIFVDKIYSENSSNSKEEWKQFFLKLKVKEGITLIENLNKLELNPEFRENSDQYHTPYRSTFCVDDYRGVVSFSYIECTTENFTFSCQFWEDVINNYDVQVFAKNAIGLWGRTGYPGRTNGDPIQNYIPWFLQHMSCIPTTQGKCELASNVFLNTQETVDIAGDYLPVFRQDNLLADWKSLFNFKTRFMLNDYLEILKLIWNDTKDGLVNIENKERIQRIYARLLEMCENFSSEEINDINLWVQENCLLNTNDKTTNCSDLKYFIDGNESIFQGEYKFLALDAENRSHPSLERLLSYFGIDILRQSQFKLKTAVVENCIELSEKLKKIMPLLIEWIKHENAQDINFDKVGFMNDALSGLKIYQADVLRITYEKTSFEKNVNVHFINCELYVSNPWNSNSVLLYLPNLLTKYLDISGHDKKIDFLIRSTSEEIKNYFHQENINIPEELLSLIEERVPHYNDRRPFSEIDQDIKSGKKTADTQHIPISDLDRLRYAENLIGRSIKNVTEYLERLPEYDCSGKFQIAPSIIGGITKNGIDITIVARPSDGDKVILYYSSEFDVLNYVNAELWYEDGKNIPKRLSMGQLLEKTGVNKIPIPKLTITEGEVADLANRDRSENFEYNPVPFTPQKIAQVLSSFANHSGGKIIFGIQGDGLISKEVVGLSEDYNVDLIMEKVVSLLNPVPKIIFNWTDYEDKRLFVIEVEKSVQDILYDGVKYYREGSNTVAEIDRIIETRALMKADYSKTIAIIIAIENYAATESSKVPPVKYAKSDAEAFKKMLITSLNVDEDDIHMLIDSEAYKNRLEYDLKSLFRSLTKEDRLIFYYAGHGFHDGLTNYLSTYDMHVANISDTSISLRTLLLDPLKLSKCNNALIFIDACAQKIEVDSERRIISDLKSDEFEILMHEFPYYATFLSCQVGESSFSSDFLEHGIWTYHLIEAMKGNHKEILRNEKVLTDQVLQQYLSDSVTSYTKNELGKEQHPKSILDSQYENVINDFY
ncbi:sacsin N-terminal ATP-binding-like domain-containing protein [Enterococcus casseliflavus]|uniref:sacsin N-terminal ATP-binding-like domain-containing protein n=1 Tax=Enterococcus casseliflavus TaxID=37734 RepID=UPI0021B10CAF|nr:caspase family protein [Enterococcus casseliflavus]